MRLILTDLSERDRRNFHPLTLCQPLWDLHCGMTTLGEKLAAAHGVENVACFVPPYLADVCREHTPWPVNEAPSLQGDDLIIASGRVKPAALDLMAGGPSRVVLDDLGDVLLARINQADLANLPADSIRPSSRRSNSRCRWPPAASSPPGSTSGTWSWRTQTS